ncbi:bacteriochlorophyll 4-vinyl reductase [Roseivivax isoporae]|nr:bacteriochlorophyll 4-vinyl reductase [Roseivivax isoporae]
MMSATLVVPLHAVLETAVGSKRRDRIFETSGFRALPRQDTPVPEGKIARLHETIRGDVPSLAPEILDRAGRVAAEVVVSERITPETRLLLQNMPWSLAAWLVGRLARQNAWAFSGSGLFAIQTTSRFALFNNPLTRGAEASAPACHFHTAMFEHMFQRLVHRDFLCSEVTCCGAGHDSCTFCLSI